MINKELLQENQYRFPYHHLTHEENGVFYLFRHLFWGIEHYTYIQFVIQQIASLSYKSLLDVGCGEGRIILDLHQTKPEAQYYGIDISEKAIRFAQAFNDQGNFSVHDITLEPLTKTFDVIVSCEVIEHIEPPKVSLYISNIAKSLSPGGNLIITTPTTNVPVNKKHYQHFTREIFDGLLKDDFTIKKVVYLNQVNLFSKFLSRLIANRWYISNCKLLNRFVLRTYRGKLLFGNESTGSRIYVHAIKN